LAALTRLEWSARALADLERFALFLRERHPRIAGIVGSEILKKAEILSLHPRLGRPVRGRREQYEVVLQILNATYVLRYGFNGERLVVLRVYHGRELRE
jgi:plasmid stabilization system protein ParE